MRRLPFKTALTASVFMLLLACQKELSLEYGASAKPFTLNVDFKPMVNGAPLQFNTPYLNASQEAFTLRTFKFYIHNIKLLNTDSNTSTSLAAGEHYLVDAAQPASLDLRFEAAASRYNAISLTIGVDSARNFSGAQTGALDPTQGMFWTWNSGYIMAKVEGSSPLSKEPNQTIEYHIGGYRSPNSVLKTVVLPFPGIQKPEFGAGTAYTVTIDASVDAWFGAPNPVHFGATPVCMSPGELALQIAENYSHMLTVREIVKN